MSFLFWAGIGFGLSLLAALPMLGWVKKTGSYAYATARCRAITGKLLGVEEMERVGDEEMSSWLEGSDYWPLLQKADGRLGYEAGLENLERGRERKLLSFAPEDSKKFLKCLFRLERKLEAIKAVVNAVESGRSLPLYLLPETEKLDKLLEAEGIEELVGILQERNEGRFVSMKTLYAYGSTGVECALDRYFFHELKKSSGNRECERVRKAMKRVYLYRTVARLKKRGYGPAEIAELLGLKEKRLAEMEMETLMREIARESPSLSESIMKGSPYEIERAFDKLLLQEIEKIKHTNQLGFGVLAETAFRSRAEADAARRAWWLR